ncbi:hypothetical protein SAMN05444266_101259 [Chitinophaga jiangningensis]|uniref:Uncharacterized protein n=1 Tax=Chitinophaga jiangningensis TaxID=1419482 RepID=A0A1M6VLZ2_9BACT|nr:hypothetical protein SAMN05444266_101259 [Chitinophaga jiangningensis]
MIIPFKFRKNTTKTTVTKTNCQTNNYPANHLLVLHLTKKIFYILYKIHMFYLHNIIFCHNIFMLYIFSIILELYGRDRIFIGLKG